MKTRYILTFLAALALFSACHKPEFIETTADRQGLTSLTAIFSFGPYTDQEMAKLTVTDDTQDRFVIPIPYFFPPTSEDETLVYMTRVRVQAELQPNYTLSPPLTLLDLTEENWFTYTDPHGNSREICITGERVKSAECVLMSFVLDEPAVAGVIDQAARTVILPTKEDVSAATARVQLSPHAAIFPNPAIPRDYSQPFTYTVTAHDGTEAEYTVMVGDPEKIDSGINPASVEKLFNFDPVSRLGLPDFTAACPVSIAAIGGQLVICPGDGSTPITVNGLDGTKTGTLVLGSAVPGSIANDAAEHLLITNVARGGDEREVVNLYRTSSVKDTPTLLYSFENPVDCPIGHKMKVMGDIDHDAVIIYTVEGIDGITSASQIVTLTVRDGEVASLEVTDFAPTGLAWGSAPVNVATVVPASADPAKDGWFLNYYEGGTQEIDCLHWISPSLADTPLGSYGGDLAWGNNANCLDTKTFNKVNYLAMFVVSHFPAWGIGPKLYLYDVDTPSSPGLLFANETIGWYQQGSYAVAAGDVTIAPSADGFKVYVYYYDHNSQVVGGYVADCIKR